MTPHSHDGHTHSHGAGHLHDAPLAALRGALILTALFFVAEAIGGWMANSLALLADAGHMLADVAALGLSLFMGWFSRQPSTPAKTYGYLRWEILAAFLNAGALLLISVWIGWEAIGRLREPEPVRGGLMLVVAIAGLGANLVSARLLHSGASHSLNIRGAYLHVLSDLLSSAGTIVAALLVTYAGWRYADPAVSLLTTVLIIRGAWQVVRESVDVLLEATPSHIPLASVRAQLEAIPGVESVHDLHVWTVTSGMIAMSAHAIVREPARQQHVLEHVHDAMRLFGIAHVTVQLESREMYEREKHLHA